MAWLIMLSMERKQEASISKGKSTYAKKDRMFQTMKSYLMGRNILFIYFLELIYRKAVDIVRGK